ncbi:hypothetical protein HGRIS_008775 [Hohenbuehelia grisea]|uniref:Ricin B lectin domain-containing protein n=1 Tax=Hohenbuehelia grisea TaxID=104357 RepID=A0ABR3J941_9AGAR
MPRFLRSVTLATSAFALLPVALAGNANVTLVNKCEESLPIFINGKFSGKLAPHGGSGTGGLSKHDKVGIWTSAAGGSQNGVGSSQVYFRPKDSYYFTRIDGDNFNVAISVKPNRQHENGLCAEIKCNDENCSSAYRSLPESLPEVGDKAIGDKAPAPPLFRCPEATDYTVTFCPDSAPPPLPSAAIPPSPPTPSPKPRKPAHHNFRKLHPNGKNDKCIEYRGEFPSNGAPVQIFDCDKSKNKNNAQLWELKEGRTSVKVAGTNFCLDATDGLDDGAKLQIWECNDKPQQRWFYTQDKRLALDGRFHDRKLLDGPALRRLKKSGKQGKGLCLDLTDKKFDNENRIQVWKCTDHNENQIWTL